MTAAARLVAAAFALVGAAAFLRAVYVAVGKD
jgi:hypothetical protein